MAGFDSPERGAEAERGPADGGPIRFPPKPARSLWTIDESHPETVTMELVLSLFPGIDLLGRAFAAAGYAVVSGPDLLFDTRIEDFHAPPSRFDGIVGSPPCQNYSDANRRRDTAEGGRPVRHFVAGVDE